MDDTPQAVEGNVRAVAIRDGREGDHSITGWQEERSHSAGQSGPAGFPEDTLGTRDGKKSPPVPEQSTPSLQFSAPRANFSAPLARVCNNLFFLLAPTLPA